MSRLRGFLRRIRIARAARSEDEPAAAHSGAPRAALVSAEDVAAVVPAVAPSRPRVIVWRDWLQRTLATDGYVVQGFAEEMSTGSVVRMWGTDVPFEIMGPASYEQALRQWRRFEKMIGEEEMEPPRQPSAEWRYYKTGQGKLAGR
jgi:hypothetical protein